MRIGLVSTLATPVRAAGSGSVESLVFLLARELAALGQDVTVFAAAGSVVPGAALVPVPGTYGRNGMPEDYQQCELLNLAQALARSPELDVLHSHAYLLGRLVERLSPTPLVHTLHTQPYDGEAALIRLSPDARLTAPSSYQWSAFPDIAPVLVPHGIDVASFAFRARPEPRLCYLGRFIPGKGPLQAIGVAREVGLPLVMAGPETDYFTDVVRPHVDDRTVHYAGSINGRAREELLGGSAALLSPVIHGEPFGLVLAEAMMCGTPVVATDVGAAPEVVEDGVTGRVTRLSAMAAAVPAALALDRARVREAAVSRFSSTRMARQYAEVYRRAVWTAERDPRSLQGSGAT